MPQEFQIAYEVEQVARWLISDYHPHLRGARIEYVFLAETPKSKGKLVWGRAKKVSGVNAWLATAADERDSEPTPFFVIEISKPIWDELDGRRKAALVDHELSHLAWDDETDQITIASHNLEEFVGVIQRHGLWRDDVELFGRVCKEQLDLFGDARSDTTITISAQGHKSVTMTTEKFEEFTESLSH